MLAGPEPDGDLISESKRVGRTSRNIYKISQKGFEGRAVARARMQDLKGEAEAE